MTAQYEKLLLFLEDTMSDQLSNILESIKQYAEEQGVSMNDALVDIRSHEDFEKPKRGRPRKDKSLSPDNNRPRGRPPSGTYWDEKRELYINQNGTEYIKVESPPNKRRRGRPPSGTYWDEATQSYINNEGSNNTKKKTYRPRGRPPTGKIWDDASKQYIAE